MRSAKYAMAISSIIYGGVSAGQASPRPDGPPPMNETVTARILPQVDKLMTALLRDRQLTTIDGVRVLEGGDRFLPGKIAYAMAYRITALPANDPRRNERLSDFAAIAAQTLNEPNDSWGIYYYLAALDLLQKEGLLEQAMPSALIMQMRSKLDWRHFVRDDLTLINLPNNYYGVAFAIARLRNRLGWEDSAGYRALLTRTLDHYRRYSGRYGFADETAGEGRFDRYSVLLIGEIAQRLIETDLSPPPEVRQWLRKSVDLMLPRFNATGEGFEYGRSIGAYGETAFLEVLTAAAQLKLLTPVEERMAYAFSSRIASRYVNFWLDDRTGSVNLWDSGRRTDAYRGKHRILGENLSLARQFFYTNAIWNDLGYKGREPDRGYDAWLTKLPRVTVTRFADKPYDRAVVTIRDGHKIISLPLISGGHEYHARNTYFPIPFSTSMLQGAPDTDFPQLLPRLTLVDGSILQPLSFFEGFDVRQDGATTIVSWRQPAFDRMGNVEPESDSRATISTQYRFSPGTITREDTISVDPGVRVAAIDLSFASFSSQAETDSNGVSFQHGDVTRFVTEGFGDCTTKPVDAPTYRTPTGAFRSFVRCHRSFAGTSDRLQTRWSLSYSNSGH